MTDLDKEKVLEIFEDLLSGVDFSDFPRGFVIELKKIKADEGIIFYQTTLRGRDTETDPGIFH